MNDYCSYIQQRSYRNIDTYTEKLVSLSTPRAVYMCSFCVPFPRTFISKIFLRHKHKLIEFSRQKYFSKILIVLPRRLKYRFFGYESTIRTVYKPINFYLDLLARNGRYRSDKMYQTRSRHTNALRRPILCNCIKSTFNFSRKGQV